MTRQEYNHQIAQYKYSICSGSGIVTLDGGIKCVAPSVKFYGVCVQDGVPTPEASVPVKCNNAKWQVCGKNLFDKNTCYLNKARIWASGVLINETNSITSELIPVIYGETYVVSCSNGLPLGSRGQTMGYDKNKNYIGSRLSDGTWSKTAGTGGLSSHFTIDREDIAYVAITLRERSDTQNDANTLQFEINEVPTTYEPYHDGGAVDLSLLPDGGLYGIGDVRDEWDAATGKGVRHCGKISSYAGEAVGENWISSTSELSADATIIYQLAAPVPFTATPQPIIEQNGYNQLLQESGDIARTDAEVMFVQHS